MQNNNQFTGAVLAIAFIGALAWFIAAIFFAVIAVLAVFFTLVAIAAWNEPLTLWGQVLQPQEARDFVKRGLIGAVLVPIVLTITASLLNIRIYPHYLWYMAAAGYAIGSVVIAYWIEEARVEAERQLASAQLLLPTPPEPSRRVDAAIVPPDAREQAPFRFATWDDEEELRK